MTELTPSAALHPRIAELIAELTTTHQELVDVLDEIPADHHDAPPTGDRWSVSQLLEHLAMVEGSTGRLISRLIKEATGTVESDDSTVLGSLDQFQLWAPTRRIRAPEMVCPSGDHTAADALAQQSMARERLIDALRKGSGLALATVHFPHPILGPLDAYQWALMVAQHTRRHIVQLRALSSALSS